MGCIFAGLSLGFSLCSPTPASLPAATCGMQSTVCSPRSTGSWITVTVPPRSIRGFADVETAAVGLPVEGWSLFEGAAVLTPRPSAAGGFSWRLLQGSVPRPQGQNDGQLNAPQISDLRAAGNHNIFVDRRGTGCYCLARFACASLAFGKSTGGLHTDQPSTHKKEARQSCSERDGVCWRFLNAHTIFFNFLVFF